MGKVKELLMPENRDQYVFMKKLDVTNEYDRTGVRIECTGESNLSDLLEAFEEFLKASGFIFRGQIELVDDTDDQ